MSIVYHEGVVIGTNSKSLFVSSGKTAQEAIVSGSFANVAPGTDQLQGEVAMWGTNNLLPQEITKDIEATGVLSAGIDTKARILIGKGPTPARVTGLDQNGYEQLEFVPDGVVIEFMEAHRAFEHSFAIAKDLLGYGNTWVEFLLSRDRKQIAGFRRIDTTTGRLGKMDTSGRISNLYLSADWNQWSNPENGGEHVNTLPLLDRDYPLYDLQERTSGYRFAMAIQYPLTGRSYYAASPWWAARKWVKIAQGIPELKEAMFKNQMTLKYVIEVHPAFWEIKFPAYKQGTAEQKLAMQNEYYQQVDDLLVGGENAYKSIISTMIIDSKTMELVSAVKVTPIDDKIKDGKLLPDSGAANSEILFALGINPALMGADMPGGPYSGGAGSGSNIREAYLVQIMLGEAERRLNNNIFNLIKNYNGWDKDIVIRYPNQILTTLNTGANTQPTA